MSEACGAAKPMDAVALCTRSFTTSTSESTMTAISIPDAYCFEKVDVGQASRGDPSRNGSSIHALTLLVVIRQPVLSSF